MTETIRQLCSVCGNDSRFVCDTDVSLREARCSFCGANVRNSDLAKIVLKAFSNNKYISLSQAESFLSNVKIYEAQSIGPVHDSLCRLPHYTCSEFFPDISPGQRNRNGVLCQDLQNLTFPSENFDLIITQDVFEHILEPEKAFYEIWRVLKPGGFHIFTVPFHEGETTLRRVVVEYGKLVYKYPPVYHGDPLREQGVIVCTDFGTDIDLMIRKPGFNLEIIPCGIWYSPSEIPFISDEKEYQIYKEYSRKGNILKYFKYNSWVFLSKKVINFR